MNFDCNTIVATVTFFHYVDFELCVFASYDVLVPCELNLSRALTFATAQAECLMRDSDGFDPKTCISDVKVDFRLSSVPLK